MASRKHERVLARRTPAVALTTLALLLSLAATAWGSVSHDFSHTIGGASSTPPNPHPIGQPSDVAVDAANGSVFVTDPGNHRVEKFDSTGNFLLMFGKGVNQTTGGDLCTAASADVCQTGTFSLAPGGFQQPYYLAIDNYPGGGGAVYVLDKTSGIVQKFTSGGQLMTGWGVNGQKDGSDATDFPGYGSIFGLAVGRGCVVPGKKVTGPCVHDGRLFVGGGFGSNVWEYTQSGEYVRVTRTLSTFTPNEWLKADPFGNFYYGHSPFGTFGEEARIFKSTPQPTNTEGEVDSWELGTDWPTTGLAFDPSTEELYQGTAKRVESGDEVHPARINRYSQNCDPPVTPACDPLNSFGEGHLSEAKGIGVDGQSHTVYVANSGSNDVAVFKDVRPIVTTGEPTGMTDSSVTLTGHIDPAGRGDVTECYFEYGFDESYGEVIPCVPDPASNPPGSYFTGPTDVTATITGLSPKTVDHFRLVATNENDATATGLDNTFSTTAAPAITALTATNLTATTADLVGQIVPNGLETTYRFEYGVTLDYGSVAPIPDGVLSASEEQQEVTVHLSGLTPRVVYHYRLVAENSSGTTTVEDHTFNFYPPGCPNENVRQQVKANFLPDCRAYELVSPGDAGGTQLYANGPNTGYATSPSRFSFTGLFNTLPGSGGSPIAGTGDLYVATRTDTGWVSRYVGWAANRAAVSGGPPQGPPGSTPGAGQGEMEGNGGAGASVNDGIYTDLGMNRFLTFNLGNQSVGNGFFFDMQNKTPIGSNAPLVFAADGTELERWPTNLATVPDGSYPPGKQIYPHGGFMYEGEEFSTVAPGGMRALDCPTVKMENAVGSNYCPGDVIPSADLSHFVFATQWHVFAPGGQLSEPGSVYDNQTDEGTVVVASKTPGGANIPAEIGNKSHDPLRIPAVSKDGTHILMAAGATGPCGFASCPVPPCRQSFSAAHPCQIQPSHLYMRVDASVTYDVSKGHAVDFVGIDGEGSKVYFLSDERLTGEDLDTSTDLYRWAESSDSLTLVSRANDLGALGEPGNSDDCLGGMTTSHGLETAKCGVSTYTQWFFCGAFGKYQDSGGNCLSDNSIASASGDIFFMSQELLDGTRGIPNQENIYVFRNGAVQYVATLTGPPTCFIATLENVCQRLMRLQVSPDGEYMAFVTPSPVTQFDNAGRQEMYRYNTETEELICVSCIPSGAKPTSDVEASRNGLFMANDGRTFFSTEDPLVHTDTNKAQDVYEYVEGRAQLITPGTGDTRTPKGGILSYPAPGLIGVSADAKDVFFSVYDTLVPQDNNGLFLKFYDARAGGGFSAPAPPLPCEAADECHGPSSQPASGWSDGTGTALGDGGNLKEAAKKQRKAAKKRKQAARKRKAERRRGAKRRQARRARKALRNRRAGR